MTTRLARTTAFTLVELLVVIGIIGVLMGIMLPVLSRARASSRVVSCKSNLRQIGLGLAMYNDVWRMYPIGGLRPGVDRFVEDHEVFRCPSDPDSQRLDTYSLNYRGGHPQALGDELEVLTCVSHTIGPPFGLFADGRVDDIPRLKDTQGVLITGHLNAEDGPVVDYPFSSHTGADERIFFYFGGQWNSFRLRNATLSGLFLGGSQPFALADSTMDDFFLGVGNETVPIAWDYHGFSSRYIGSGAWGRISYPYENATYTSHFGPIDLPLARYGFSNTHNAEFHEGRDHTLFPHVRPRRYGYLGRPYRGHWEGAWVGSEKSNCHGEHSGFIVTGRGIVNNLFTVGDAIPLSLLLTQ